MSLRSNGSYIGPRPAGPTNGGSGVASGIWDLRTAQRQRAANAWPFFEVTDPDFANVSLLLHMDGSNGSTTFTDSSNSGHSFAANGDAQISTAESKFGGASAYFDGTGDYLSLPYNADFDYGQGPFTIEMWFNAAGFGVQTLYAKSSGTFGVTRESSLVIVDSNRMEFYHGVRGSSFVGRVFTLPFTLSANTWYHVAFSRDSGNNMRLFVNGVASSDVFNDNTSISGNLPVYIGVFWAGSIFNPFTGYIDDFRITKGVARYTANFTPPTAAFPDQ